MKIPPPLVFALTFAVLAIVTLVMGQRGQNPFFLVAALAFTIATYVTYPPLWATELAKMLPGKRNNTRK
jgi:predicted MFS family arabinose efflux permease